jgi:GNAT superfamily N-acetyltransferase
VELRPIRLDDPLMAPLIEGMTAEYEARYGEADEMAMATADDFDPPGGVFLGLFDDDGTLVAGGGLRRYSDHVGEIKRMWTSPHHRRRGLAAQVLTALEDAARAAGYVRVLLETGPNQPEAVKFYAHRGYVSIPTYSHYDDALAFRLDLT